MATIRRLRSNLSWTSSPTIPTWHLTTLLDSTLWLSMVTCTKQSLQLMWSPFSTVNTPIFPIIVLHYSGFLKCSLPKHLYWSFLAFPSFLAQINHPGSFTEARTATLLKLSFSLSLCLSSNIWFIVLLFLNLYSLSVCTVFERDKCPFCPLLYLPILRKYGKIDTLCFVCSEKCIFLLIFRCSFDFHFLI